MSIINHNERQPPHARSIKPQYQTISFEQEGMQRLFSSYSTQELVATAFTNKLGLWAFHPLSVKINPGRLSIL